MVLLGVDLRTSTKHPSSVAALGTHAQVVFLKTFHDDRELFDLAREYQPSLIAIGTPLGLPNGLCCLEPNCQCRSKTPHKKGRESELELARMGISCFFTTRGSIIRKLIYRGIQLYQELTELGHNVIEVYPHATKVILFGDRVPPKNSSKSLAFMQTRLPELVSGLDPLMGSLDRNGCDALINAYTAVLHANDRTDLLGTTQEGLLALPRLID